MSSIQKIYLIICSFILLAFVLSFTSGFLPAAGAAESQKNIVEDNVPVALTLEEVLAQRPVSVEGLLSKGNNLYSLKEYELSIGCFEDALKMDSNSSMAWYGKGCALAALERYEESIVCYDRAIETFPVSYGVWYEKGNEQLKTQNYVEAINSYEKSLAMDNYLSRVWFQKAIASEKLSLDQVGFSLL